MCQEYVFNKTQSPINNAKVVPIGITLDRLFACSPIVETRFLELAMSLLDFLP